MRSLKPKVLHGIAGRSLLGQRLRALDRVACGVTHVGRKQALGLVGVGLELRVEHCARLRTLHALLRGQHVWIDAQRLAVGGHGVAPALLAFERLRRREVLGDRRIALHACGLCETVLHLGRARPDRVGPLERRASRVCVVTRERREARGHCRRVCARRRSRLHPRETLVSSARVRVELQRRAIRLLCACSVTGLLLRARGREQLPHLVDRARTRGAALRGGVRRIDLERERELQSRLVGRAALKCR
jgi:hypothetical protein